MKCGERASSVNSSWHVSQEVNLKVEEATLVLYPDGHDGRAVHPPVHGTPPPPGYMRHSHPQRHGGQHGVQQSCGDR